MKMGVREPELYRGGVGVMEDCAGRSFKKKEVENFVRERWKVEDEEEEEEERRMIGRGG